MIVHSFENRKTDKFYNRDRRMNKWMTKTWELIVWILAVAEDLINNQYRPPRDTGRT